MKDKIPLVHIDTYYNDDISNQVETTLSPQYISCSNIPIVNNGKPMSNFIVK